MKHQWKLDESFIPGEEGICYCDSCGVVFDGGIKDDECSLAGLAFPLVVTKTKEEAMAVARFWLALNKQDYCNN